MLRAPSGLFLIIALALAALPAHAQVQTGTPPFGSFGGGPDVINLANLNAHHTIPVRHKPGRGIDFTYDLSYDSSVWFPVTSGSTKSWQPVFNWGWRSQTEVATGYVSYSAVTAYCIGQSGPATPTLYKDWIYHDNVGVAHQFPNLAVWASNPCGQPTSGSAVANDGSGYTVVVTSTPSATVTARTGQTFAAPLQTGSGVGSSTDRNGNKIGVSTTGVFTDTLGTTALTVSGSGTPTSPLTFTYTAPSGASASFSMSYVTKTVKTNFGCSGIAEYGPTSASLVDKITLPNGSFYQFNYEATPGFAGDVTGRIQSITLPAGGQISYTYTGGSSGHITCADGSASGLTRTTPDGTWTYTRTAGTGAAYTTKVTDPQGNDTLIQFQGIYETQRQVYQGSTSGTLLSTTDTCYNNAASPCTGTEITLQITQRATITTIPSAGSANLVTKSVAFYNSVGAPTELDAYAFGAGSAPTTPTHKTLITYASLGNITAFRQTVTVQDGTGATLAKTNYNYDETAPVAAPTGTAELVSVSGSRGNLTSVQRCTVLPACTSFLTTTMTYL